MWYVIQVVSGREEVIRQWIQHTVSKEVYKDCRIILYERQRRYLGTWHKEYRKMFPGYLFIISEDIAGLRKELKKIPELTKLLGYDDEIIPLAAEEEHLLKQLTEDGICVKGSLGIQVGDRVLIQSGPLAGLETVIRKIDRHKRKALIDVTLLGSQRQIELGLEVVEKV